MQLHREQIDKMANPFLILECEERDLGSLILRGQDDKDSVIRVIRGNKTDTKQDCLNEVSAALQFPYYFGENWDAFEECINDLQWLRANNYLLIVTNVELLLSAEPYEELEILMGILRRAAGRWESLANLSHLPKPEKGTKAIKLSIVLQVRPDFNPVGNLKTWLDKASVPRISTRSI